MLRKIIEKLSLGLAVMLMLGVAVSCKTPKDVVYFQDLQNGAVVDIAARPILIKPLDKLNIIVNTRDPQVTDMFNLPYVTRQIGQSSLKSVGTNQGMVLYTVNLDGKIDFPYLGEIEVAGQTRQEAAFMIKGMLIGKGLAVDPIVTVEISNAQIAVLGEVQHPGNYAIDSDNMTILDAIGAAGDLTIYGERENVKLIRKIGDREETYVVNLLSGTDVMNSPAYYVQQDDVIYIEPNPTRIRQSSLNANTVLSTSFWISMASVALTIVALIVR